MIQHLITPFQRNFLTLRVYMINLIALQINRVNSQCEKVSLKGSYEMLNHIISAFCRQSFHFRLTENYNLGNILGSVRERTPVLYNAFHWHLNCKTYILI